MKQIDSDTLHNRLRTPISDILFNTINDIISVETLNRYDPIYTASLQLNIELVISKQYK